MNQTQKKLSNRIIEPARRPVSGKDEKKPSKRQKPVRHTMIEETETRQ